MENKCMCVYVTDIHVDDYPDKNGRDRLEDCLKVIDDVYKLAIKKDAKIVLLSGDLYNTTKFLYTKVINRVIERFNKWMTTYPDIIWYAITGNHDFATKNLPDSPAISALTHLTFTFYNNFKILDNGITIPTECIWKGGDFKIRPLEGGIYLAGIPNYEYKEHFIECLKNLSAHVGEIKRLHPDYKVTLLIHQLPSDTYNSKIVTDVNVNDPLFDCFDMVLCGDDHNTRRITDKFIVGGSPLHHSLKDEGKEKGIWSLDLCDPVNTIKFHSRIGRYPEFIRVKEADLSDIEDVENNFVIVEPNVESIVDTGNADVNKFGSTIKPEELLTNFFSSLTDGTDKELLKTGLSFIK